MRRYVSTFDSYATIACLAHLEFASACTVEEGGPDIAHQDCCDGDEEPRDDYANEDDGTDDVG